jgi:hypothetical protein
MLILASRDRLEQQAMDFLDAERTGLAHRIPRAAGGGDS